MNSRVCRAARFESCALARITAISAPSGERERRVEKKEPPRRSESDAVAILVLPLITHVRATRVLCSAVPRRPLRALCAPARSPRSRRCNAGYISASPQPRSEKEREGNLQRERRERERGHEARINAVGGRKRETEPRTSCASWPAQK